jgi:hypothetical protein
MSIADTGRFWEILEILVIPVLQILEDSGKYWLYQYCRYWNILENTGYTSIVDTGRLATKLRNVLVYCFSCPVCASVMRGRTVYRETGRKEKMGRKKRERRKVKRGGRNEKKGGRKEKSGGRMDNVCFTILVLPVLLDEEYWSFQYRVFYNTSITSIVG